MIKMIIERIIEAILNIERIKYYLSKGVMLKGRTGEFLGNKIFLFKSILCI